MTANSPDQVRQALRAHQAMVILRLLDGALLGTANDRMLATILDVLGLRTARAELKEMLDLLEREGAVETTQRDTLVVVRLKHHGHELAQGLVTADGIERPSAECPY